MCIACDMLALPAGRPYLSESQDQCLLSMSHMKLAAQGILWLAVLPTVPMPAFHELLLCTQERANMACWQDPQLGPMWAHVHGEWRLGERLAALEHTVSASDQMQQLGEYQQPWQCTAAGSWHWSTV